MMFWWNRKKEQTIDQLKSQGVDVTIATIICIITLGCLAFLDFFINLSFLGTIVFFAICTLVMWFQLSLIKGEYHERVIKKKK